MPKTLLLADDSVVIQKLVGLSFANEDVELITTDNGDDAIARAREAKPHLVLADVVMPGKNGYEVCEAIKNDPELAHVPVLLLTGTFEAFDEDRAAQVRSDGHITKPFEAQALVERVNELIERSSAPALSAAGAPTAPPTTTTSAPDQSGEAYDFFDDDLSEPLALEEVGSAAPSTAPPALDTGAPDDSFAFGEADDLEPFIGTAPPAAAPAPSVAPPLPVAPAAPAAPAAVAAAPPAVAPALEELTVALAPGENVVPTTPQTLSPEAAPALGNPAATPLEDSLGGRTTEPSLSLGREHETTILTDDFPDQAPAVQVDAPTLGADDLFGETPRSGARTGTTDDSFEFGFSDEPLPNLDPPTPRPAATAEGGLDVDAAGAYDVSTSDLRDPLAPPRVAQSAPPPELAPEPPPQPAAAAAPRPVMPEAPAMPERPTAARPEPTRAPEAPGVTAPSDAAAAQLPDLTPAMRQRVHETLEKVAWEAFADLSDTIVRQVMQRVESIAWEVIPQMAETLIQEEIRRMKGEPEDG